MWADMFIKVCGLLMMVTGGGRVQLSGKFYCLVKTDFVRDVEQPGLPAVLTTKAR